MKFGVGVNEDPPILICSKCRRPMKFMAILPALAGLPAVHTYICIPCKRVDTV